MSDVDSDRPGVSPEAAFELLANETRVATLEALWESWGETVPFSALRRRVGVRDAGQFHYHLSKLCDHFVNRFEDGYELTPAGFKLAQAVVAGTGIETPTVDATTTEHACPRCGADVEFTYADGAVRVYCGSCRGFWNGTDEYGPMASGYLGGWEFPPAGLEDRSPAVRIEASITYMITRTESLMAGVCPDCGGLSEGTLTVCDAHDPVEGLCGECGRHFLGKTSWRCDTCKLEFAAPSWAAAVQHPTVRNALASSGLDYRDDPWRAVHVGYEQDWEETVEATDPLRLRLTIPLEGVMCEILLDDTGAVVEVTG